MQAFNTPFAIFRGSIAYTNDYDQIVRCQVIDALTTNQGERVMQPDWGCNVQSVLFNPAQLLERNDTATYLKQRLQTLVPRAFIQSVVIDVKDNEPNVVYITVQYRASRFAPNNSEIKVAMNLSAEGTS